MLLNVVIAHKSLFGAIGFSTQQLVEMLLLTIKSHFKTVSDLNSFIHFVLQQPFIDKIISGTYTV